MTKWLQDLFQRLLDSVLQPIGDWLLKTSWLFRAAAVVVLGLALSGLLRPDVCISIYKRTWCFARVAIADRGKIPIQDSIAGKLRIIRNELSLAAHNDLAHLQSPDGATPWSASQTVIGLGTAEPADIAAVRAFLAQTMEARCHCWREIPESVSDAPCVFISGWALAALAQMSQPADTAQVAFLLEEQNPSEGWWSTFPVPNSSQYASTYSTSWALIGLGALKSKNLLAHEQAESVSKATTSAARWLSSSRENGARWKPYPKISGGAPSLSISGVALHALHVTNPEVMQSLDQEWLTDLSSVSVSANDAENSYLEIRGKYGVGFDHFVQIQMPWLLVGTVDAFPNGTIFQRTNALYWLENTLDQQSVLDAGKQQGWWRSELLYSLRYLLEHT